VRYDSEGGPDDGRLQLVAQGPRGLLAILPERCESN
jgi:hypothetical protein